MRLCAIANGYLNGGCPPASVTGGYIESGSIASAAGFFGPSSRSLMPVCVSPLRSFVCCAAATIGRLAAATSAAEVLPRNDRRLTPSLLILLSCSAIVLPLLPKKRSIKWTPLKPRTQPYWYGFLRPCAVKIHKIVKKHDKSVKSQFAGYRK